MLQTGQCPKCRTSNSYTATACIECGARLPWADAVDTAKATPSAQPAPQPATSPGVPSQAATLRNQSNPTALIIGVLVTLIGLWIFARLLNGQPVMPFGSALASIDKTEVEQRVCDSYNEEKSKEGKDVRCVRVSLVKETDRKYTGFAEMSGSVLAGQKMNVVVTFDDDGSFIYKFDF